MPSISPTERRLLGALTAAFVALLLGYSLLLPLFRSPDEAAHVDLSRLMGTTIDYPEYDQRMIDDAVMQALAVTGWGNRGGHLTAETAVPRGERPTFDDLDTAAATSDRNQLAQHPPAYYVAIGAWDRAGNALPLPAWLDDVDGETWRLRLANVLLTGLLPALLWWAAREGGLDPLAAIVAAAVPLCIPQVTAIGAAVNNDNLFVVVCAALTALLLRIARRGDERWPVHAAAGALIGLALFTKGFGLTLPAWYVGAVAVGLWRSRSWRRAAIGSLTAGTIALVLGGWWWVRNVLVYDQLQPSIQESRLPPPPAGFVPDYRQFVHVFRTTIPRRFWGDFGSFDVHLADGLTAALTVALLGGLAFALLRRPSRSPLRPGERLLLAVPIGTLLIVLTGGSLESYRSTAQFAFQQGRYLFGALAAVAILLASTVPAVARRHPRRLLAVVLAAGGALQLVALWTILRHYWGPSGGTVRSSLRAAAAWSPFPAAVDALVLVGGVASVVVLVVVVARSGKTWSVSPADRSATSPASG